MTRLFYAQIIIFRCWRFVNENIYYGNNLKNKKNLLLLIGENAIIHYKITEKNTY